jgi:hypothetical protein
MINLDYLEKWERELRDEGRAQSVLLVLEARGLKVSAALRKRVLACTNRRQLDRLRRRAVVVASARELFS